MSRFYKGFKLDDLEKRVYFSHSDIARDLSEGKVESDKHTVFRDRLLEIDKRMLNEEQFQKISALNSVVNMNYQVCNGGISQYYENEYDLYREPQNEQDVAQLTKVEQIKLLDELLDFGLEVFPERETENRILDEVISQFKLIHSEPIAQYEWFESEEDQEIWDEAQEDWVDNPDYEEPYEEFTGYEEELVGDEGFDEKFSSVNDYLETLLEGYAQYLYQFFDFELSRAQEKPRLDDMIQKGSDKIKEMKSEPIPMTEQEYLDSKGVGSPFGEYQDDKLIGHVKVLRQKSTKKDYEQTAQDYWQRREAAKQEYHEKVASGELRDKTSIERALTTAHGHEDLAATQAARRMLTKRGIDWETGEALKGIDDRNIRR